VGGIVKFVDPGATITLTIEDGGGVVYSDSQIADTDGNFNFNLWDVFDLQRGQVVTVSMVRPPRPIL